MNEYEGPLFVIGMPRSGTKLLRQLLNQHPSIRIPAGETEFFPWLARYVDRVSDLCEFQRFQKLYKSVRKFPFFLLQERRGLPISPVQWYESCQTFDAPGIFEGLNRSVVDAKPGSGIIWGDKSPSYIDHIPLLHSSFPNGRFVHIIRDVRDYCLSMYKAWGKDMPRAAQRWSDGVSAARSYGRKIPENYYEVRYEDLLQDPECYLRLSCEFLGVNFLDSLVKLPRSAENRGDTRGQDRIVADNVNKYIHGLTQKQIIGIEQIAGSVMSNCGYQNTVSGQPYRRLSPVEMEIGRFKDVLNLIRLNSERHGLTRSLTRSWGYFRATKDS